MVRKLIEDAGCRLIYLPSYSPEYNPIEHCWSKLKAILRALKARTQETLCAAVHAAGKAVSFRDTAGWFGHCGYPLHQKSEPIAA